MIERSFHTPGPLRLDLSIPAGTIDVETVAGEETQLVVDADDERSLDDLKLELVERGEGHELVLTAEPRGFFSYVHVTIGARVLGTGEYRVRIRCPHGADLVAKTATAAVVAHGTYGRGDVKTTSGDVRIDDLAGDVEVRSVSGDVRVRSVGGRLVAKSVSGDLRFENVSSAVQANTVSGDLNVVVADGDVNIVSVSGDIEVGIRSGSRLHVDANSLSGSLDSELPLADAPNAAGGGPLVDLRAKTVSGDFRVVRA